MKISKNWTSGRRKTEYVEARFGTMSIGSHSTIGVAEYFGTRPDVPKRELCFHIITSPTTPGYSPNNEKVLKLRLSESEALELLTQLQVALHMTFDK